MKNIKILMILTVIILGIGLLNYYNCNDPLKSCDPERQITVENLNNLTYNFTYKIKDISEIPVDNGIKQKIDSSEKFALIQNYTGEHVNSAYLRANVFIVQTMTSYRLINDKTFDVEYFSYDPRSGIWRDSEGPIEELKTNATEIWFRDSSAGAESTSVTFNENRIFINGYKPDDVLKAAERFTIIFLSE